MLWDSQIDNYSYALGGGYKKGFFNYIQLSTFDICIILEFLDKEIKRYIKLVKRKYVLQFQTINYHAQLLVLLSTLHQDSQQEEPTLKQGPCR